MKIKRFLARDMRAAFRMVREEQGPDAVILSSRRIGDQIEQSMNGSYSLSRNTKYDSRTIAA